MVKLSKGRRWMPRRREAKKDVASCEKPRGAAKQALIRDVRMGKPDPGNAGSSKGRLTWGSETSQYPEEKKSNEIP
jgi:hypothetical protein